MAAAAADEIVTGNAMAITGIVESNIIIRSLHWIGFTTNAQHQSTMEESFGTFDDIRATNEVDVDAM